MLDLASDLHTVFFGPDFATPFVRTRHGLDAVPVVGILGAVDEEALEGRVMAAVRELRLPASYDLRAGDELTAAEAIPALGVAIGAAFRVLEPPQRDVDGAEQIVLLGSATP